MNIFFALGSICTMVIVLSALGIGPYYESAEQRDRHHRLIMTVGGLGLVLFGLGLIYGEVV